MKERPILFSAPMVRALLDGRKTQTRRIVKPWFPRLDYGSQPVPADVVVREGFTHRSTCPYGVPGDRLWVRETWGGAFIDGNPFTDQGELATPLVPGDGIPRERPDRFSLMYRADFTTAEDAGEGWFPSIHMPRWASRLTLTLTDVRVERVQDISEVDALAEGCFDAKAHDGSLPSEIFLSLFYDLNKRAPRTENPWVWALTFKLAEAPQ